MKKTKKICAFGCGEVCAENKRLCEKHLEHQRTKMAEYRLGRKKRGLCSRCPNVARVMPNGRASTLCEECRTHVRNLEQKQTELIKKQQRKAARTQGLLV